MTTRVELLADIDAWFARDDLTAGGKAPTFLRMAEAKINRRLRVREMESTGTILTVASTRTASLPTNWLSFRSLTIDNSLDRVFTPTTPELIREHALWGQVGQPELYSIEANVLYLAPMPSEAFTLDAVYFSRLAALTNDSDTNDVLTNHYDLYLNAVLEQAAKYIQDAELATYFKTEFEDTLAEVNRQDSLSRLSGGAMRSQGDSARAIV